MENETLSARDKISLAMDTATENETVTAEVANSIEAAPLPTPATPATPELSERIASLEASLAQRDTSLAEAAQTIETLKKDFTTAETAHLSRAAIASQEIETLKGNSSPPTWPTMKPWSSTASWLSAPIPFLIPNCWPVPLSPR